MDGARVSYHGLNLHMLEMHGEHHDENFCILQDVYPVVG